MQGSAAPPQRWLPAPVWRAYLIGWVPLFLVYMIAYHTDGDWSRGFKPWAAIRDAVRGVGPAFLLLLAVWPFTGWMERRRFGMVRQMVDHVGMAIIFAVVWHLAVYTLIWVLYSEAAAERARQGWFIWQGMWGVMLYGAVAGGFTAYRAVQKAATEAAAAQAAQTLLARSELAALRNKLNPHFLFNTLHSILALVRRDGVRAEKALLMFSDMLRYVLDTERSGNDQVTLQQEFDFTRDYLALEAIRLGDRLKVDWQVDPAVLSNSVAALTVQPVVENSIKHAFNPRSAPGLLTIRAVLDGGAVLIEVRDDGPGSAPGAWRQGDGLGLKTVERRIAMVYGSAGGFDVRTAPGEGFVVTLRIPEPQ